MANEVSQNPQPSFSVQSKDHIDELLLKSIALIEVLGASALASDPPEPHSFSNACWTIKGMLHELNLAVGQVYDATRER